MEYQLGLGEILPQHSDPHIGVISHGTQVCHAVIDWDTIRLQACCGPISHHLVP